MLDTVVYRIYGLSDLTFLGEVNEETGELLVVADSSNADLYRLYFDTNKLLRLSKRSFVKWPSWSYEIAYRIDYEKNYVEFNLSIPKLWYGTNVFMLALDGNDREKLSFQFSAVHSVLVSCITRINKAIFPGLLIDPGRIQVSRIDLCYNRVFNSPGDAKDYYNLISQGRAKYSRTTIPYHGTTIFTKTKNWSFKVYQKGPEFQKHDSRKLKPENFLSLGPGGWEHSDKLDKIKELASCTLRYELTARNALLSKCFWQLQDVEKGLDYKDVQLVERHEKWADMKRKQVAFFLGTPVPVVVEVRRDSVTGEKTIIKDYPSGYAVRAVLKKNVLARLAEKFLALVQSFTVKATTWNDIKAVLNDRHKKQGRKKSAFNSGSFILFCRLATIGVEGIDENHIERLKDYFPQSSFYRFRRMFLRLFGSHLSGKITYVVPLNYDGYIRKCFELFGKMPYFR